MPVLKAVLAELEKIGAQVRMKSAKVALRNSQSVNMSRNKTSEESARHRAKCEIVDLLPDDNLPPLFPVRTSMSALGVN